MITEVKIDNVDVTTSLSSWKIEESFGQFISEAEVKLAKSVMPDTIPDVIIGQSVTIKRGEITATEQFKFDGYVNEVDKSGALLIVRCVDKLVDLQRASVNYSYDHGIDPSAGVGSAIAEDIIETWGGMTSTVTSTGAIDIIKKFICNNVDVYERLLKLCEIYDYQLYYDPDDGTVHFEPLGTTESGNTIYVGGINNNALNLPVWKQDASAMFNRITIKGAVQEVQDEEFFNGTGAASQNFILASTPIVVQAWEYVGGNWVMKVPGIEDQIDQGFDYYADKDAKKIVCTNWTPSIGSNNVKIVYTKSIPVPVQVEDDVSIGLYGVIHTERIYTDIESINDAEARGRGLLDKYSTPFITTTIKVAGLIDYEAGQKVRVIDILNNEDRTLLINKVTYEYPHNGDRLDLGDEDWRIADWGNETIERVRRLEEELQKNVESLTTIKDNETTLWILPRYKKLISQNIGHAFIVGHPVNGRVGEYNGVDGQPIVIGEGEGAEVDDRVIWPNNKYIETFMDEDFKSSSTANWDTSTRSLKYG